MIKRSILSLVLCYTASCTDDSKLENEKLMHNMEVIAQSTIEVFCAPNSDYLNCTKISSQQCKTELKVITEKCSAELMDEVTVDLSEENNIEALSDFGQKYTICVAKQHFATGNVDQNASKCFLGEE